MTNCWSEGALRAYLDRELPPADMKAVAEHLGECSVCDALCAELAGRAARVFELLESLPGPETVSIRPTPARAPSRWFWTGAAVALAAGLAIASIMVQKRENPAPVAVQQVRPEPAAPQVEAAVIEPAPVQRAEPVAQLPKARSASTRVLPLKRPATQSMDYFVALDDRPIESGVIMRMAIQPGNAQADIVFDPEGRPRAIRLVNDKSR